MPAQCWAQKQYDRDQRSNKGCRVATNKNIITSKVLTTKHRSSWMFVVVIFSPKATR
uniref:Uncharacterized protein n=1 Tax=Arundo donax TaxID=35708 RepID=A0A0A8XVD2_ARUDO